MPDSQVRPEANERGGLTVGVVVALAVVLGGIGIYLWMGSSRSTHAGENRSSEYPLPLETFVVNLGGGERGYLRVGIALGLSRVPARKEDLPVALVRDTILSVLSTVRAQQLAEADGKNKLKAEILQALKDRAPQLGVVEVYFTEFLVQQ